MCKKGRALCNKRGAVAEVTFTTSNDFIDYSFFAAWTDAPFFHVEYDTTTLQTIQYENTFQNF